MTSNGLRRPVDQYGHIVIPKKVRLRFGIDTDDPVEFFIDGNRIILKKHNPGCLFCNKVEGVTKFYDYDVCRICRNELTLLIEETSFL